MIEILQNFFKSLGKDHWLSTLNSRRGSLIPGSRRGSGVSLGGVERRGSYYSDDVSKKATVAMVVDGELVDGKDSIFDMGKSTVQENFGRLSMR